MTTYYANVAYIEELKPGLVERNSDEFQRLYRLLASVELDVTRARKNVVWESESRAKYDSRMNDAEQLGDRLARGFAQAGAALLDYAVDVRVAARTMAVGIEPWARLKDLISSSKLKFMIDARRDPMKVWDYVRIMPEVVRKRVGISAAEFQDGNRLYVQADAAFHDALKTEKAASGHCAGALRSAHAALPDFQGGDFAKALQLVSSTPAFVTAVTNAGGNADVRLPGYGPKEDDWPSDLDGPVSDRYAELQGLKNSLDVSDLGADEHEWVRNNKELFAAAAAESGIPPELLAAIMYKEEPDRFDQAKVIAAEVTGLENPDTVSLGQNQIQVRRAAEVFDYDPGNFTPAQRHEVIRALNDPAMNVLIAAEHLERIKAGTDFAHVPSEQLSPDQLRELAARYNSGDDWDTPKARDEYAGDVLGHMERAKEDLA